MRMSSNKLDSMAARLDRINARLNRRSRVGVESIRAFLRGEPDPFPELGPPDPDANPRSMRGLLFGRPRDDEQEADGDSS